MSEYYRSLLSVLTEGNLERRTDLKTGCEAIYKDGQFLFGDGVDKLEEADLTESIVPEPHLVLFGSGHIAKALYDLAVLQDMKVTVLDCRGELANFRRFPKAHVICDSYKNLLSREYSDFIAPYFCIFTHGHTYDEDCLLYSLNHRHTYIGMIGSKAKVAHCLESIREKGITDSMLTKLHSPVGLSINAVTPQEIAISIMAQIISVFRENKKSITVDASVIAKAADEKGIMVRIVEKEGSAPRSVGSAIFVTEKDFLGTVGGGAVENHAIDRARRMLEDNETLLVEHHELKGNEPLGMTCGGSNTLLYKLVQ